MLNENWLVEPLLSGHPLLTSQLPKSRIYCHYNTVNQNPYQMATGGRGILLVVPMGVFLLFLPISSGHQNLTHVVWPSFEQPDDR